MKSLLSTHFYFIAVLLFFNTISLNAQKISLDRDWKFHLGDVPFPVIQGHGMTYENAKAGQAWGAAAPNYKDGEWRLLNLPHDWAVEQPYDSTENVSQGYRKRGVGWYRKQFKLDVKDKGKYLELQFDGIATHASIWFNGTLISRNFCGYNSIYLDITPYAYYGERQNVISIRVDAQPMEGWWYEGAGIYRHTWLVKRSPVHLTTDGVYAQPVKSTGDQWLIPVDATLYNSGEAMENVEVETSLLNPSGQKIASATCSSQVGALKTNAAHCKMVVERPALWTLEQPALYKVVTVVKKGSKELDRIVTTCGFRTIQFTPDSGFYLNNQRVKLKGVCNHQDHAGVGVAVPDALWEFRLRKLKEMGVNAYRCSHNPPSAEFLAACDSMGILVMDENRNFNVSAPYTDYLEWMVKRDRNHPSVILWSVFNEEPMQGSENGYELVRRMTHLVKQLDTTRPVTAAANGGLLSPKNVAHAVDVIGMNYQVGNYDQVHKAFPNKPVTSSEDASAYMVRGEYVTSKELRLHDSYDTQAAPWGTNNRDGWKKVDERDYLAGCFIWTGFDYRGEPQPYVWPAAAASFGILDQCGFPKAAFYIRQAQWLDKPVLQLIPHWNWPADSIGKPMKVMALTNMDYVKLYLNGKKIKEGVVDKYQLVEWMVPYKPGKLEAVGLKGGKEILRSVVETTGEATALQLLAYRNQLKADGADATPVTVQVLDAKGRLVPTAQHALEFSIEGPAEIIGLGNGNPNSHEPEKGTRRSLFNGLAQVIVQSKLGVTGEVKLKVQGKGLVPFELKLMVE